MQKENQNSAKNDQKACAIALESDQKSTKIHPEKNPEFGRKWWKNMGYSPWKWLKMDQNPTRNKIHNFAKNDQNENVQKSTKIHPEKNPEFGQKWSKSMGYSPWKCLKMDQNPCRKNSKILPKMTKKHVL